MLVCLSCKLPFRLYQMESIWIFYKLLFLLCKMNKKQNKITYVISISFFFFFLLSGLNGSDKLLLGWNFLQKLEIMQRYSECFNQIRIGLRIILKLQVSSQIWMPSITGRARKVHCKDKDLHYHACSYMDFNNMSITCLVRVFLVKIETE